MKKLDMNCGICGNKYDEKNIVTVKEMMFGSGKKYQYKQCDFCNSLQLTTPERNPALLYPFSYYSFNNQSSVPLVSWFKKRLFREIVKHSLGKNSTLGSWLSRVRPNYNALSLKEIISLNQKILDVGCGDGSLIEALASLGYNVEGVDPYIKEEIRNDHYVVYKKHLSELESSGSYDLIMLHHSFEHMDNPSQTLSHLFRLLKNGGTCMIRIPVADSFAFKKYRENWVQIDAPRHIFLHTNKSIELLALAGGFTLKKIINDSTIFQFIGSEQYEKGISLTAPNSFYRPFYKNWLGNNPTIFKKEQLKKFAFETEKINAAGEGDQRTFLLIKKL